MLSTQFTHHLSLEVSCPACPETYAVPLDAIEQSQRFVDEYGPCSGIVSYECPTPYLASLAPRAAIARLHEAVRAFEEELRGSGARAVWADGQPDTPENGPRLGSIMKALLASPGAAAAAASRAAPSPGAAAAAASRAAPSRPPSEVAAITVELTCWDDDGGAPQGPGSA
ncbi:hypothetical protein ACSRUE_14250 [Sorangium sp. KYC3313]|uniref:hypothetical protein n=1 Tax=Sorangium sp. KYC3313 TaxID=3449740 RepID=UPI003F8C3C87